MSGWVVKRRTRLEHALNLNLSEFAASPPDVILVGGEPGMRQLSVLRIGAPVAFAVATDPSAWDMQTVFSVRERA